MLKGFAVLLSLQAIGELITLWLHLPLPGSVLGMLLLLFGLRFGLIELEWVKDAAELLLSNLSLLFVPAGVGIMVYAELIARQWVPPGAGNAAQYPCGARNYRVGSAVVDKARRAWSMTVADFVASPLFGVVMTLLSYTIATAIYRRWPMGILNPVVITAAFIIAILSLGEIPYAHYAAGGDMLLFLLGPAVVALGVPLYQRRGDIVQRLVPTICAVAAGALSSMLVTTAVLMACGSDLDMILSLAPKSVTTPIAIGIAEKIGGIVPLTAAVVVITGCFGAMAGPFFCRLVGVRDPFALGLAMGTAAHGLGTGRMLEIDRFGGAMAGLAIGLNGIATAVFMPFFIALVR